MSIFCAAKAKQTFQNSFVLQSIPLPHEITAKKLNRVANGASDSAVSQYTMDENPYAEDDCHVDYPHKTKSYRYNPIIANTQVFSRKSNQPLFRLFVKGFSFLIQFEPGFHKNIIFECNKKPLKHSQLLISLLKCD